MTAKPVLVAHNDPETLERLTIELHDRGYYVLGPATTASIALTLAAQTPVAWALLGDRLGGRRHGPDLAKALRETWGVRSFVLRDAAQVA